jgi:spermidine synthase
VLAYVLTIFTGAFLLFQVQPLIGKYILPWFGGGPGVWTTCMLFFQVVLLGGYAYAHCTSQRLKPRAQAALHVALLIAGLGLLPITPSDSWKPRGGGNPTLQILALLAASLGLPYFVLSSTGPLLQHWFSRTHPAQSPYRLYALSNAGSLLALVSFPFLFEPHLTRKTQASVWGWGLAGYAVCCAWCAVRAARVSGVECRVSGGEESDKWRVTSDKDGKRNTPPPPPDTLRLRFDGLFWLLLPACASVLLLATTNKICQDIAVIPFLWILPLGLYLLSFIICFDNPRWYRRLAFGLALAAALGGVCWTLFKGSNWSIVKQVGIYCGGLFICCMVCHGELYRLRPDAQRLTLFYLMIAAGGALGGLFVAVGAPLLFSEYYELHWGLGLCGLLFGLVCGRALIRGGRMEAGGNPNPENRNPKEIRSPRAEWWRWVVSGMILISAVGLAGVLWVQAHKPDREVIQRSRNFYGVLTVYEHRKAEPKDHHFLLQHGRITHGLQFVDAEQAAWPTTYYGEESGVGLALRGLAAGSRRIGLVGLGAGTLAAYGRAGDYLRIYEINPQVQRLAASRFTYLANCPGKVEVALGDARVSMENEPPQHFDLLALDAFSGDAIPVHLLTKEAFEVYHRHVQSNGVIAVHVSNHHLDLEPVVLNLARHFHYQSAVIDYEESEEEEAWWLYASTWILLTHDEKLLKAPAISVVASTVNTNGLRVPLWTDEFASLFPILK